MILAEKIIKLRKQNGWSQEDLAMHMDVSRQSVSKWESMSSIPELDKIIKLSQLFRVSTDYLLKDEIEEEEYIDTFSESEKYGRKKVTLDEANAYMDLMLKASVRIAAGVAACIFSPVILILMSVYADIGAVKMNPDMAAILGTAILLIIVACAVILFITTGIKTGKYEYMEKELLELEYGIAGIVQTKKEKFADTYKAFIAIGVGLCIISVVPLLLAVAFDEENEFLMITTVGLLLTIVAAGVFLIIKAAMTQGTYERLLEEGEYTQEKKINNKKNENISTVYWCIVLAVYLGWSFITMDWQLTWIVWPVAGILFGAVIALTNMIRNRA